MADEQAGSNPPETKSYEQEMAADVRGAMEEVRKAAEPAEPKVELEAKAEPEVKAAEPKGDHPTDPNRYADGTFKAKSESEPVKLKEGTVDREQAKIAEGLSKAVVADQSAAQPAPVAGPPGGFSVKTKAEWDKIAAAYPSLVADIAKREKEVADGFAQYEGMRELRPYVELARSQGQTLKQALDRYTNIENSLRQRPLDTLLYLAGNAGYSPQRLVQELAPQLGLSMGQPQSQPDGAQPPFDPRLMQQWLSPLAQEINQLKSLYQQQTEAATTRERSAIGTVIERFKADPAHRYYENVEDRMAQLFEGGVVQRTGDYATDLKTAYDMACRMDPEISDALLNERMASTEASRKQQEKEAAEKARQASRSITGSASGIVRKTDDTKGGSPFDDARRAYNEITARA